MILLTFKAPSSSISVRMVYSSSGLNSEYHLYCHVTRRMTLATVSRVLLLPLELGEDASESLG
jgi:hypothetical protein